MRGFGGDCQAGLSRWRRRGWCASRQAADGAVAAIPVRRSAWPRLASGAESPERDRTAGGRIGAAARAFDPRASHRYAALHARAHSDATGDRSYDRDLGRGAQGVLDCDRVRFWAAAGGDHSAAASHPCRDSGVAVTAQIAIRPLRLDERAAWEPLWKGYLDFYRITAPQEIYDATWARLHDPNEPMWLLGGYVDGKLLGIVHYIYHRSCWTIGDYCYLQDLFVAEGARKLGLGRARGRREPRPLAHARDQRRCAQPLRHAGGPPRLHPVSQALLTKSAGALDRNP